MLACSKRASFSIISACKSEHQKFVPTPNFFQWTVLDSQANSPEKQQVFFVIVSALWTTASRQLHPDSFFRQMCAACHSQPETRAGG